MKNRFRIALVAGTTVAMLALVGHASADLIFFDDFEGGADPAWSDGGTDVTPVGQREFLGRLHDGAVSLTLSDLPPHTELGLSFDLFVIGLWDGNESPDIWGASADGGLPFILTTFRNETPGDGDGFQAYPDFWPGGEHPARTGASENDTLGYDADAVYHLSYTIPHTAGDVVYYFFGFPDLAEEDWGLDNVSVTPEPCTAVLIGLGVVSLFSRRRW